MKSRDEYCEECFPYNWTCQKSIFAFLLLCSVFYVALASKTASNLGDLKLYATDKETAKNPKCSPSPNLESKSAAGPPHPSKKVAGNEVHRTLLSENKDEPDDIPGYESIDFNGFKVMLSFSVVAVFVALACSFVMFFTDWGSNGGREVMEGMSLIAYGYSAFNMAVVAMVLMSSDEIVHIDASTSTYNVYTATWPAAYFMMSIYGVFLAYHIWQRVEAENDSGYTRRAASY